MKKRRKKKKEKREKGEEESSAENILMQMLHKTGHSHRVTEVPFKKTDNSYWDFSRIFIALGLDNRGEGLEHSKGEWQKVTTVANPFQMAVFPDNAQKAISSDLMPLCHLLLAALFATIPVTSSGADSIAICAGLCEERRLVLSSSCCHGNEISASECLIYSTNRGSSWHCFDLFIILQSHCLTIQPLRDSLDH